MKRVSKVSRARRQYVYIVVDDPPAEFNDVMSLLGAYDNRRAASKHMKALRQYDDYAYQYTSVRRLPLRKTSSLRPVTKVSRAR